MEFQKETDEVISEKLKRLLETDIVPVVCIGETLKDFEKGLTKEVLKNQIDVIFNSLESDKNIIMPMNQFGLLVLGNQQFQIRE